MSDYLDLPPELRHLIEKREQDDRRKAKRDDVSARPADQSDDQEKDRPNGVERRKEPRRESDR